MTSLQLRLNIGLLLSLLAVFVLLWVMVSTSIRDLAEDYMASRLQHDTKALLAAVKIAPGGDVLFDHSRPDAIYSQPFSGHYFSIQVGRQTIRSRSLWDQDLEINAVNSGEIISKHTDGPRGQPLFVITTAFEKGGQKITIAIAEDLTAIEKDIAGFQAGFALLALGLLLLLIVLQTLILRLGMRPLANIRHEVKLLERGERDHLSHDVPDEVRPLIGEINHLLQVLGTRLQRSRNALGDLAHAMKKPLTVLSQLTQDEHLRQTPELKKTIAAQVGAMQRTTDHILKRARLAGEGPVNTICDITAEVPLLIETLRKMHAPRSINVELHITEGIEIRADREDLLELLGNLMDNAFKWAKEKIHLSIKPTAGQVQITIEDDGPGVPAEAIEKLAERGARLDEQTEGHGLGLAIVQDIVELYNGSITMGRSVQLQGFQVRVTLPG
jgi:signal transduction histidine kinase